MGDERVARRKKKKDGVPASLKAPPRRSSTRQKGLSPDQEEFCQLIVIDGHTPNSAGALIPINAKTSWTWSRKPTIVKRIEELRKIDGERRDEAARNRIARNALDVQRTKTEVMRVVCMQKPHQFRGYRDKLDAAELVFEVEKVIAPRGAARITATAGAQAAVLTGSTVKERYKALWLLEKEAALRHQCEVEYAQAQLPPNGPDTPPNP